MQFDVFVGRKPFSLPRDLAFYEETDPLVLDSRRRGRRYRKLALGGRAHVQGARLGRDGRPSHCLHQSRSTLVGKCGQENGFKVDYISRHVSNHDRVPRPLPAGAAVGLRPLRLEARGAGRLPVVHRAGQSGWVGLHHASLLGDFDGHKMWPWFSDFLGKIKYRNYIPTFAAGTVAWKTNRIPACEACPSRSSFPTKNGTFTITARGAMSACWPASTNRAICPHQRSKWAITRLFGPIRTRPRETSTSSWAMDLICLKTRPSRRSCATQSCGPPESELTDEVMPWISASRQIAVAPWRLC